MPRIDDAPGMSTCITVPGFVITVIGRDRAARARDLDRRRGHHRLVDARLGERRRRVERAAHHRRRAREVGDHLVAADRQVDGQLDVAHVDPVRVEVVGERRGAVGPARDLAAQQLLGVVEQAVHQRREPLRAVARGELLQRAVADVARGDLRREVAEQLVRDAHVRAQDVEQRLVRARPPRRAASTAGAAPPGRPRCCRTRTSPGTRPPTSPWCATVTAKPISVSPRNDGLTTKMSGVWLAPSNGSLTMKTSPGRKLVAEALEQRAHRVRDRAELQRDRDRLRDRLAARRRRARPSSPSRRARPPSARCGRSSSPSRRRRSRARCRRGASRSRRRARRRPRRSRPRRARARARGSPASRRTVQPGGTTTVVSYSSTSSGPGARLGARATARETTGASSAPCAGPKSARRVPLGVALAPAGSANGSRSGPSAASRSARMSTGEPGSSRVPYSRSCSSSKRSTSAAIAGRVELAGQLDRDAPALAAVADVGDAPPLGLAVDPRREVRRASRRRAAAASRGRARAR